MPRPFLPMFVPLVVLLLTLTSASSGLHAADVDVQVADAPPAVSCSPSAAAGSQVVAESCTEDIVRSFFGVHGREICCRALEAVGAGCYRAVFSGSPFANIYPTILGNVCGLGAAPAPSLGRRMQE